MREDQTDRRTWYARQTVWKRGKRRIDIGIASGSFDKDVEVVFG
jgi:hypothetical protein